MNLKYVFEPKSIAVIGASSQSGSVGNDLVKNLTLHGYRGDIYPVNPKLNELYSLRCFPNLEAIPGKVEMALIAVPAPIVMQIVKESVAKKVKSVVIITAGFKEAGHSDLEKEIAQICEQNDIALVGPNCLGVINPEIKMNASFSTTMPDNGSVAFITQSGALATAILDYAQKLNIGFSKLISMGNKSSIDEVDVLEYLADDKNTKAIAIYAENLSRPRQMTMIAKKLACGKYPKAIFILKSGRTEAGAKASASHTGAIAGSDAAYDALFQQSGMIRVRGNTELFEYARTFANNELHVGNRLAVVTNAGGPGVLAADEAEASGLKMANFSDATKEILRKTLPQYASISNPVDMLGDAKTDRYQATMETVIQDENVDSLLAILTPQSMTEIEQTAQAIIDLKSKTKKPIVANFIGGPSVSQSVRLMQKARVATVNFPEQGAKALAALCTFNTHCRVKNDIIKKFSDVSESKARKILLNARKENKKLNLVDSMEILEAYGFTTLKHFLATNAEEAKYIASKNEVNFAMKIVSEDISHKTDIGGVILNVTDKDAERKYLEMMKNVKKAMPQAKIDGVLLEEMVEDGGVEMILGIKKDPALGSVVMVGLGGIYVEVFKDVSLGIAPLTEYDSIKMIEQLKSNKILNGIRGKAPLDAKKLTECLCRLSQLAVDFPEIQELDINPLVVLPKGVKVLDARIII